MYEVKLNIFLVFLALQYNGLMFRQGQEQVCNLFLLAVRKEDKGQELILELLVPRSQSHLSNKSVEAGQLSSALFLYRRQIRHLKRLKAILCPGSSNINEYSELLACLSF